MSRLQQVASLYLSEQFGRFVFEPEYQARGVLKREKFFAQLSHQGLRLVSRTNTANGLTTFEIQTDGTRTVIP